MFNMSELAAALKEFREEREAGREFRAVLRAKMKFEVEALLSMPGLRSEHKKALSELQVKLDKPTRL